MPEAAPQLSYELLFLGPFAKTTCLPLWHFVGTRLGALPFSVTTHLTYNPTGRQRQPPPPAEGMGAQGGQDTVQEKQAHQKQSRGVGQSPWCVPVTREGGDEVVPCPLGS